VTLPSGERIAGPQPVRDSNHVMGFPWVPQQMKIELRRSNNMALRGLRRGASTFGTRRYLSVEHPYNSWLWYLSLAEELVQGEFGAPPVIFVGLPVVPHKAVAEVSKIGNL